MKKGTLLVIDDEPVLVGLIKFNVEEYTDEVLTAGNGIEALEVLETKVVHCILCDINMPKMNGLEFVKKLRENGNNVPLIFYTAHGTSDLMLEAAKYGAFDFLNKPSLDGLEDVVERGLCEGFDRRSETPPVEIDLMNEYQKILKQFNDSNSKC